MALIQSQSNPTCFPHAFHNHAVYFNYYLKKKIMLVSCETESQGSQSRRRKLWGCYIRVAEDSVLLGCGAVSTWTSGSQHIERSHCLHNRVEAVQEALIFFLDCISLKMKACLSLPITLESLIQVISANNLSILSTNALCRISNIMQNTLQNGNNHAIRQLNSNTPCVAEGRPSTKP